MKSQSLRFSFGAGVYLGAAVVLHRSALAEEPAVPKAAAISAAQAALRSEVGALAKPHCGSCHQASQPSAVPAALAVFDLDRGDWATGLGAKRLKSFLGRIKGKLDDPGLAKVKAFIATESSAR